MSTALDSSEKKDFTNEKKRSEPEDPNYGAVDVADKRRKSNEREKESRSRSRSRSRDRDRDYRDRDRDYRDRDRDYRDRDRSRDRDRDRDRDYSSSSRSRDHRDRDYYSSREKRDRDYYSSSSSRSSRDHRDRDRDRDYRDHRDRDRDYRDRDRDRDSTSKSRNSDSASKNRDSKEKETSNGSKPSSVESPHLSSKDSSLSTSTSTSTLPEPDEESDQRTVFVSKISQNTVEKDLYEFFAKAGTVLSVQLIIDKVTKKNKGVGYVEFSEKSMVDRAVSLSGSFLDGQAILVHAIQPEKKTTKPVGVQSEQCRIYVGYIHLSVTEEQIRAIFQPYGEIEFINIHTKPNISKYAFIQFKTQESAKRAIAELNGYELMGKNLKLNIVSQEKNANGTYVQIPQINNIVHHNYTPNLAYNAAASAVAALQHQGFQVNPYYLQQHQQQQQQQQHFQNPAFQAQIQAHLHQNNNNSNNMNGNNSNQHTFKENTPLSSLDEDDGGIPLTAQGRALLTAKLQGKVVSQPPVAKVQPAIPQTAVMMPSNSTQQQHQQVIQPYTTLPQFGFSSTCLILRNMFDPDTETEENWDQDITSDTHSECSQFGKVEHIYLDKNTKGCIYIRYDNTESPLKAIQKLHGRWFSKKQIVAELVPMPVYKLKFPF